MYYAIKTIDRQRVDLILTDWNECKNATMNKTCEFAGFSTMPEAEAYLKEQPVLDLDKKSQPPDDIDRKCFTGNFEKKRISFDNGYTVATYLMEDGKPILCNGYNLPDNRKATYLIYGSYQQTKKYGWQFTVTFFEEVIGDTEDSVVNYLSCGIIKGIGKKKAKQIYTRFGEDTIRVLDECPNRLMEIPGIKKATCDKIKKSYQANKGMRKLSQYLIQFDISQKHAAQIYKKHGIFSIEKIKENPYLLCHYKGITFLDADRIARFEHVPMDSDARFEACAYHVLFSNEQTGNSGMEINAFGYEVWRILNGYTGYRHDDAGSLVDQKTVNQKTIDMIKDSRLRYLFIEGKHAVFRRSICEAECNIADNLRRLSCIGTESAEYKKQINRAIGKAEADAGIKLDLLQSGAVYMALLKSILVINGAPGTGKTTTLKVLSNAYRTLFPDNELVFLAPTGRAARKIAESTGEEASTIHSYLKIIEDRQMEDDAVIIENSLVVIDEFSMIDISVADILFSSIGKNCHVAIVGDIDQLESVGPGSVMRDILGSGFLPSFRLVNVYRQDSESTLYENICKIKEGKTDLMEGPDFHFLECKTMEAIRDQMADAYVDAVNTYGLLNVMCLCPYLRHTAGVEEMNAVLQKRVNPPDARKQELTRGRTTFREGDLIMYAGCNNPFTSNGDIGVIKRIANDTKEPEITVIINGRVIPYKGDDMDSLTLAYAMSVHKSQGSEADAVITCLCSFHNHMLYRNIPYVAVSRGKKQVFVFGQREAFDKAIRNEKKERRITSLGYHLALRAGDFVAI